MSNADYFQAIKSGDLPLVQQILDRDPTLAKEHQGVSPIMTALYYGAPQIVPLLIERGAQIDIFEAAALGEIERLRQLLAQNPALVNSFSPDGFQPLGLAAYFGYKDVVVELIAQGAEVNSPSRNTQAVQPIHSAAASGHSNIVKILLKHGANANAVQLDSFTPLHEAAQNGDIDLIKLLLEYGAQCHVKTSDGSTPYDLATTKGHQEAALLL